LWFCLGKIGVASLSNNLFLETWAKLIGSVLQVYCLVGGSGVKCIV
jgi:hypothetical protein